MEADPINNAQQEAQDVTAKSDAEKLAQEEALLAAQQTSLAETKKRRKE